MQGVEAAVHGVKAAAHRGRLALELAEDVPGAARQVGELRQQADQGVRADLLQRAEKRRARGPGRLGPAQPRGLHGPLVKGHGRGRAARARGATGRPGPAKPSSRPPSARGASPHPTQRKVPGSGGAPKGSLVAAARRERRGGREGRTDGRAGRRAARRGAGGSPGSRGKEVRAVRAAAAGRRPPTRGGARPRGERKFPEQLPGGGRGGRGGEGRRESRRSLQGGRKEPAAPSLPPDWRGRRKRGKCRRHRARGRGGERKERGRRKGPARGTTCGSRGRRAQRPEELAAPLLCAPSRDAHGRSVWGLPRRRSGPL